jgi:hypothetical protein
MGSYRLEHYLRVLPAMLNPEELSDFLQSIDPPTEDPENYFL